MKVIKETMLKAMRSMGRETISTYLPDAHPSHVSKSEYLVLPFQNVNYLLILVKV